MAKRRAPNRAHLAWLHHSTVLADGRELSWTVMPESGLVECYRVDGRSVHNDTGDRLLIESGHADAELVRNREHWTERPPTWGW